MNIAKITGVMLLYVKGSVLLFIHKNLSIRSQESVGHITVRHTRNISHIGACIVSAGANLTYQKFRPRKHVGMSE